MALRPGDRQLIKEWNEGLVLNTIRRFQPITRVEISERTGLGRSTVTVITGRLIRQGLVEESGSLETADAGRRPVLLRLVSRSRSVLGIKLAPESVTAAALDLQANLYSLVTIPLFSDRTDSAVVQTLAEAARRAVDDAPGDLGPVIGVGVVMPGIVDSETGTTLNPYHPEWASLPIRTLLEQELSLPVLVDNDANAVALAEQCYGSGQGHDSILCVTVGIGIGAGLVIDGRLHRGHRSGAGEIGHTLIDPDGPECRCGRRGCLEAVAADPALFRRTGRTREQLVNLARSGDKAAAEVLVAAGHLIGLSIGNAVNLISPELVIVGGEAVLQAGELLLAPMRAAVQGRAFPGLADVQVRAASLGGEGWVKGAAALVLEEAFRVPLRKAESELMRVGGRAEGGRAW